MLDPERSPDSPVQTDVGHQWRLLALLIAITSVGPLSLNILTPALPGLIVSFGADGHEGGTGADADISTWDVEQPKPVGK